MGGGDESHCIFKGKNRGVRIGVPAERGGVTLYTGRKARKNQKKGTNVFFRKGGKRWGGR